MPYTQILSIIIALLLIVGVPPGQEPAFSHGMVALLWLIKLSCWAGLSAWLLSRAYTVSASSRLLDKLQWASLILLTADFYLLDIKTHLVSLPGASVFPTLIEIIGICIYLSYLIVLWASNSWVLHRQGLSMSRLSEDLKSRLRLILPALIPYLILTVLGDLSGMIPSPEVQDFLKGPNAQLVFLALFIVLMLVCIPPMVRVIWGCEPLPDGPARRLIEDFLKRIGVRCGEILLWPLNGGKSCTAAVLGLIPRLRYILFTPCLLRHLLPQEIEAVLSHEIAHIRHRHILWYIIFLGAFSAILYRVIDPLGTWLLSHRLFLEMLTQLQNKPEALTSFMAVLPLGVLLVLYFRFFMGYFMRNFERQADLYVFETQGHPWNLINALEKVALLSGGIRSQPNWHHFSIAERVAFLSETARNPDLKDRHNKKLFVNRGLFIGVTCLIIIMFNFLPIQSWEDSAKSNLTQIYFEKLMGREEQRPEWFLVLGQFFAKNEEYARAEEIYRRGLDLAPENPEILNNIAWLYVTAKDPEYRKPTEALIYASKAAGIKPTGHILDTLAESLFVNGYVARAITVEEEAMQKDPSKCDYYRTQIQRFKKGRRRPGSSSHVE